MVVCGNKVAGGAGFIYHFELARQPFREESAVVVGDIFQGDLCSLLHCPVRAVDPLFCAAEKFFVIVRINQLVSLQMDRLRDI
jgi:hypothetical protein